ncbi:NLRC3 protein [Phytophthora cinnamomi]|uniref:NLRC3 protein n=1 Tax=Phytophthora cinnamomi TaxID=4785 RepID=UPI0035596EDD|nr:NLRC3 protein [Phytophthora cinnamomi]
MKDDVSRHGIPRPASRARRSSVEEEPAATPTAVRAAARAALKEEETRPAAAETPRQPAKLKPRPPPPSASRSSSPAESKTFLTALVPARHRSRRQTEMLRPPSPLESLEPSSDYTEGGASSEPPVPATYMGAEAMQQFWGIFHRQETVHNNRIVPPTPTASAANASRASNEISSRPRSARRTYLAAVRSLRLCPEPLGIVRRRVVDKTASYASGSTPQEVNLSSYRMGNAYAGAFGEGFSLLPGVESLNLSHNRIGDIVAARLISAAAQAASGQDLENVFVAANLELTQEAKEKDNPDRSLTRFEFLECVIRIAINKYFRTNVCDTPAKAVDKLMQENVLPVTPEDANEFRSRFLYTEEVSDVFTEHITLLQELYDAQMGKYCKPGEKKGMHLVELLALLEKYQIFSDSFRVRDVKDPFLACKLVVLDEMTTMGHKKLYLTDFMEIILRLAKTNELDDEVTYYEGSDARTQYEKLFTYEQRKNTNMLERA